MRFHAEGVGFTMKEPIKIGLNESGYFSSPRSGFLGVQFRVRISEHAEIKSFHSFLVCCYSTNISRVRISVKREEQRQPIRTTTTNQNHAFCT